ncbi:VRR-NUC domain-containing protein, partial [Lineolata rhizophorae]
GRRSVYVDAFEHALSTVLDDEGHLFDDAERTVFAAWRGLGYGARYLYVRLFLRKTAAWHRVAALGYRDDIADMAGAVAALQQPRELPPPEQTPSEEQPHPAELEPPPEGTTLGRSFTFADSSEDGITTLEEASGLLRLDELKAMAGGARTQGKTKGELLDAFRRDSKGQTGLVLTARPNEADRAVGTPSRRSDINTSTNNEDDDDNDGDENDSHVGSDRKPRQRQQQHLVRRIMAGTGPCIRLSLPALRLFERVHLVFFRSTEWTEKSLTAVLLARFSRRNFPPYVISRSANVFASRAALLEFEAALRAQARVDAALEPGGGGGAAATGARLESVLEEWDRVAARWRALLADERRKEDAVYLSGEGAYLRRLSPAWVYTRIAHKAALALGRLGMRAREHALLDELLAQRLFHPARRGAWYQRKALLEERYMASVTTPPGPGGEDEAARRKRWRRTALRTCERGLEDPLVHLVHHHDLQRRVAKLERALRVARRLQHDFAHVRLARAVEVRVEGVRVEARPRPRPDGNGASGASGAGTRTTWLDPADPAGAATCGVEQLCLARYAARGWRGLHAEGGVLRTLFGLLMFEVLFGAYVPHVFQTAFQTCPVDLLAEGGCFAAARPAELAGQLARLANGEAEPMLRAVWAAHRPRRTCVVGLDWGFELADLCAIVRCFPGEALAAVCRVLAQEYAKRGAGVPDLLLWDEGRGEVMFAEVKSENDRLSEAQRLWIHVLTGAGVRVELCKVVASEVRVV